LFNAKKVVAAVAVFGAGFAAFSTSSAVQAEPVSNSYSIVGSDTLEDVVNAIVNGTAITGATVRVTQNGATLGSFDATGTPYIITKPGGARFSRPNGSGEGFMALSASIGDAATASNNLFTSSAAQAGFTSVPSTLQHINVNGQVDIARSSSSDPKTTGLNAAGSTVTSDSAATIARVPFARDAIALAFAPEVAAQLRTAEGLTSTQTPYLTKGQLATLFSATSSANVTISINGTPVTFNPVIPQYGSGTRKDFFSKIGVTDPGATGTSAFIGVGQEHDATATAFTGSTQSVMPMSASRWIAMKNGASFDRSGSAVIGAVATSTTATGTDGITIPSGTVVASPVIDGAQLSPNAAYYDDTTWGRDVFLFVERARITVGNAKYDENLAQLLDPTLNTLSNTAITGASKVGKVKLAYGFLSPKTTTISYFGPKYSG
jgi:hypothetical protein